MSLLVTIVRDSAANFPRELAVVPIQWLAAATAAAGLERSGHWSQEINGLRLVVSSFSEAGEGSGDKSFLRKGTDCCCRGRGIGCVWKARFRRWWFVWTAFFAFRRWSLEPDWLAQGALQSPRSAREGLAIASLLIIKRGFLPGMATLV